MKEPKFEPLAGNFEDIPKGEQEIAIKMFEKQEKEFEEAENIENALSLSFTKKQIQEIKNIKDIDSALELVREKGLALAYLSSEFQNNKEIVLAALRSKIPARFGVHTIMFVPKKLRADKEVILTGMKQNSTVLYFASPELKKDQELRDLAGWNMYKK